MKSPEFAPLRRFFTVTIKQLQLVLNDLPVPSSQPPGPSTSPLLETMRSAVDSHDTTSEDSMVLDSSLEDTHVATRPVGTSPSNSSADDDAPTIAVN